MSVKSIELLIRIGLGAILLTSSLPKLKQPYDFLIAVYQYELLTPSAGLVVAWIVPWLELAVGASLLSGVLLRGGYILGAILFAMFTYARASAMVRGLGISCGCFNTLGSETIGYGDVLTVTLLLTADIIGAICLYRIVSQEALQFTGRNVVASWHV